jgi:hypothetical protein
LLSAPSETVKGLAPQYGNGWEGKPPPGWRRPQGLGPAVDNTCTGRARGIAMIKGGGGYLLSMVLLMGLLAHPVSAADQRSGAHNTGLMLGTGTPGPTRIVQAGHGNSWSTARSYSSTLAQASCAVPKPRHREGVKALEPIILKGRLCDPSALGPYRRLSGSHPHAVGHRAQSALKCMVRRVSRRWRSISLQRTTRITARTRPDGNQHGFPQGSWIMRTK